MAIVLDEHTKPTTYHSIVYIQATNELTVAEVEKGSPAEAVGLKAGDQIISIDGQMTKGLLVDDCAGILRGTLTLREGDKKTHKGVRLLSALSLHSLFLNITVVFMNRPCRYQSRGRGEGQGWR